MNNYLDRDHSAHCPAFDGRLVNCRSCKYTGGGPGELCSKMAWDGQAIRKMKAEIKAEVRAQMIERKPAIIAEVINLVAEELSKGD